MIQGPPQHITAMIPARLGSERLPKKNLALLHGEPLIGHAIRAAKRSAVFQRIVVNSESEVFERVALSYGVEFYRRPGHLAGSEVRSDEVVYDFAQHHETDIVVWVNSIAPLQPPDEIREVVHHFAASGLQSLITVRDEFAHFNFRGQPLNYSSEGKFARTQDLEPVQRFVYSLMMWRKSDFMKQYERDGHAIICERAGVYSVGKLSAMIVKTEEDLLLCEHILAGLDRTEKSPLSYYLEQ